MGWVWGGCGGCWHMDSIWLMVDKTWKAELCAKFSVTFNKKALKHVANAA